MKTTSLRLENLTVSDVMSQNVITVSENQTMAEVAEVFIDSDISGVVVTNEQGRCVGILSAMDFVKRMKKRNGVDAFEITPNAAGRVASFMSRAVRTVVVDAQLLSAARIMDLNHIHRLPVLDDHGHPVGLLTSMDLVAAIVNASDEARINGGVL